MTCWFEASSRALSSRRPSAAVSSRLRPSLLASAARSSAAAALSLLSPALTAASCSASSRSCSGGDDGGIGPSLFTDA